MPGRQKQVSLPPQYQRLDLNDRRWFTTADAARYAAVSPQTIRAWIHSGDLRVVRIGGFRIDRADIDHLLESKKAKAGPYRRGTHPWVSERHAEAREKRAARGGR